MQDSALPPPPLRSTTGSTQTQSESNIDSYSTNVLPSDFTFDNTLSIDENFMVLTLIYARLSMSKRGNMACIIVDPTSPPVSQPAALDHAPPTKRPRTGSLPSSSASTPFPNYPCRILSHSNNFPQPHTVPLEIPQKSGSKGKQVALPKPGQTHFSIKSSQFPELHAEARSICLAAREGIKLGGSTAYVSFPPCNACLPLLVETGTRRLVYRGTLSTASSIELCNRAGIERVEIVDKELDERLKEKANNWWKSKGEGRDETRGRLENWWAEQEEMIMGDLYREAASK
ncbi:hypothetical protein JCM5353_002215 [Sporobolomyces roseus]